MLKEIGSVFSFLTIIPTSNANLETIAKFMYVFPIVGIVIGLIVGGFGYGLSEIGIEPLIVGLLVVALTAIITGIHHTDGLADFADGLMVKGTKEQKLSAMKDVAHRFFWNCCRRFVFYWNDYCTITHKRTRIVERNPIC